VRKISNIAFGSVVIARIPFSTTGKWLGTRLVVDRNKQVLQAT
jgi:hypothetical protein